MCSCISPMASRILSFKASIVSGFPQIIVQRWQIAAPRWPNDISSAADYAIFKNKTQNIESSIGCVAHSAVVLKPNVANILVFNFCEQKFVQHGPIMIAIECNGLSLLIFEEKWRNYASVPKSAPNSNSFWVRRLFNVCERVFKYDNFDCLHTRQDQNKLHLKRWFFFFAKIGIFCDSIADLVSEAKTHWMVNWLQFLNQLNFVWRHTNVFMQNSSQWCLWNWMLMVLHPHFLLQQQYSRVYAVFGFSRFGLSMRMPVSFTFFHKITNIRSWR